MAEVLEPTVSAHGLFLEKVTVSGPQNRRLVRIVVDLADGTDGVGSAALEEVSRALSEQLDELDSISGAYTLEVTTPGIDRPLTEARHYRRNIGRLVKVETADGTSTGRIVEVSDADPASVRIDVAGKGATPARSRVIELAQITKARIEIDMRAANSVGDQRGN